MRKEVNHEYYCGECGETHTFTHENYRCPNCQSPSIYDNRFIDCDCGTRVYLDENTNECEGCGQLYNRFGQSLKPREEWEEDY